MADRWLSVDEIAEHLGVSKDTVYTWVNERRMPGHKVGRLWKFQQSEVDKWVRQKHQSLWPKDSENSHSHSKEQGSL